MDFVGGFALNIFLVVALMDLKLWQLAGQALPLFVILVAQLVVISIFALTVSFGPAPRAFLVTAGGRVLHRFRQCHRHYFFVNWMR